MQLPDLLIVGGEGLPGPAFSEWCDACAHVCTPCVAACASGGREDLEAWLPSHRRNPPRNALALLPARQPGRISSSFLTFPPPKITYSGSRAAMRRAITSTTCCRH